MSRLFVMISFLALLTACGPDASSAASKAGNAAGQGIYYADAALYGSQGVPTAQQACQGSTESQAFAEHITAWITGCEAGYDQAAHS